MTRLAAFALLLSAPTLSAAPVPKELRADSVPFGTWKIVTHTIGGAAMPFYGGDHWTLSSDGSLSIHTGPDTTAAGHKQRIVFDRDAKTVDNTTLEGAQLFPGRYEMHSGKLLMSFGAGPTVNTRPKVVADGAGINHWVFERVKPEAKK